MLHNGLMKTEKLALEVPLVFGKLCREYFHLPPERILNAFAYSFCLRPPRELILVAREESSELVES